MKKGQVYEGIVEKVVFPNKGLIYIEDGKCVIVKNTIPGQKVSFSIKKIRKGKGEGRLLEVLEKAPIEIKESVCEYFGICGGCTYLNLPYNEQLKLKENQVKELLTPVIEQNNNQNIEQIWEGIKESPMKLAYRNKMEFSFGDAFKDGPLALGMHKRGSFHDIVTVSGCKIVDHDYSAILSCVLNYFSENSIPYYHKMKQVGYLRHLLVRKGVKTNDILIDLITTSQDVVGFGFSLGEKELLEGLKRELLNLDLIGSIAGILHTYNDSLADAVKNDRTDILYGEDYFFEEILNLKFKISPFSFFQTNSLGAQVLYETARDFVADASNGKVIYDLYSGTGTIAQMLAPVAKKVIGVEIVDEAVVAARENAEYNGLSNCEFISGDVLKVIDGIEDKPEFIVLDPPREGLHPKVIRKIGESIGCNEMVYISCKPTSLAGDLEKLMEYGYQVKRVCCVDMFPNTVHVETICLLSK